MLPCGFNVGVRVDIVCMDLELVTTILPDSDVVSRAVMGEIVALLLQRGQLLLSLAQAAVCTRFLLIRQCILALGAVAVVCCPCIPPARVFHEGIPVFGAVLPCDHHVRDFLWD